MAIPVYLFCGPELGQRNDAVEAVKAALKKKYGSSDDFLYYAADTRVEDVVSQLRTESLFTPATCIVLRGAEAIKKKEDISVLINCAGVAYYGLFEEIKIENIQEMVRTNLEVPMILTRLLLRDLKKNKGFLINISSVTALSSNPHGIAYGATKAGLSSFSKSLFDEARKYGIKV
mgnify:CR=1 FL=1